MVESFSLPKGARMLVVRSGDDELEVRTPNKLWWPGSLWMLAIAGLYILSLRFPEEEAVPHGPGLAAFALFAEIAAMALTAYLSTHQWLRVAAGTLEYQLRLGPRTLSSRRIPLATINPIESMSDESDAGGNAWAYIVTRDGTITFGNELTTAVIDALIAEIMRLRDPAEPWPASRANQQPAKTIAKVKRRPRQ
ncbi:MAG: hypothetical protein JO055_03685 [Alphaproteobacteria bacterium]|nr:hypothetical protein [Alphaproteobacteria bacterium]